MLNIGGAELLIILVLALVVLGPERLPGVARQLGQTVSGLRSLAAGFQSEIEAAAKAAAEDDSMTLEGPTDRAEAVRQTQTDPAKIAAAAREVEYDDESSAVSAGGPVDLTETDPGDPGEMARADDEHAEDHDQDPVGLRASGEEE